MIVIQTPTKKKHWLNAVALNLSMLMTNVSKEKLIELVRQLKSEQNFLAAVLLGSLTVIICGSLMGMFNYFSKGLGQVLGIFAGCIIGYVVRESGKGIRIQFSILAAVLTCFAVILGEMMIGAVEGALYYEMTPWEAFFKQSFEERFTRYWQRLAITEIGSIIIAMYFSTKFAIRKISKLQQSALSEEFYSRSSN